MSHVTRINHVIYVNRGCHIHELAASCDGEQVAVRVCMCDLIHHYTAVDANRIPNLDESCHTY